MNENSHRVLIKTLAALTVTLVMLTMGFYMMKGIVEAYNSSKTQKHYNTVLLVDVDQLVKDIVQDPSLKDVEESKTTEYFERTFKKLDLVLDTIAKNEAKVIINKKAVLKGGIDITPLVRQKVLGGSNA